MDEVLRKKLLGLQKPFNPEDLTPQEVGNNNLGMSEIQRRLFEKAIQGSGNPTQSMPVPTQGITDAEAEAWKKDFGDEVQPPTRYQRLFNK